MTKARIFKKAMSVLLTAALMASAAIIPHTAAEETPEQRYYIDSENKEYFNYTIEDDWRLGGLKTLRITGYSESFPRKLEVPDKIGDADIEAVYLTEDMEYIKNVKLADGIKEFVVSPRGWGLTYPLNGIQNLYLGKNFVGKFLNVQPLKRLVKIEVSSENETLSAKDGVLYSKDFKELVRYPSNKIDNNFKISDDVVKIKQHAFYYAKNLYGISLGENVEEIEKMAFSYCKHLRRVRFNKKINTIGIEAFYGTSIDEFNLENTAVKEIPNYFASGCQKTLEKVVLPRGLEVVRAGAFNDCTLLKSVYIPKNVYKLNSKAFQNCKNLKKYVIRGKDTLIGKYAIGYSRVKSDGKRRKIKGTVIYAKKGSYAHKYAKKNGFKFKAL